MSRSQASEPARRRFIASTAAAAAATTIVPRHVLGGSRLVAPSDKVNVAVIGVGGQGLVNTRALLHQDDCQVIALADVCEEWDMSPYYYGGLAGRGPARAEIEQHYRATTPGYRCAAYEDFRVMLEKEKAIDAVLIATPDHLHAYVSILAMKAGKHVYCEKPLTHNVAEARLVARVAKETGVATQMGNFGRSSEGHRLTAEWIWDGAIGQVREVHAWADAGDFASGHGRPQGTPPEPPGLNWDLWLGPREYRPYHPAYAPFNWRGWWAFGGGGLPDTAPHHLDPAFNALELDAPETIEATGPGLDDEVCSTGVLATWHFPARGRFGPLVAYWYDGGLQPPTPAGLDPDDPKQRLGEEGNGILFIGEKGMITCAGWSGMPRLLPLALHRSYRRPPKTLPRVEGGHHADWLRACRGGKPACSNFDYASRLTELVLLGDVALRARKQIKWDRTGMRVTNSPQANQFLREPYRAGWELP
ncbi:MAG TPA: Gfo/Idh/MocA family oxidoreductase [Vicinamibacteria bacterium]|nr:Gfo/Idh/MocA family oxidoreductase [Vicinamibacteria bacterium]